MNWILGGLAVVFVGPTLLRALAANPEGLKSGATFLDETRAKGIALGKKGAKAAYEQSKKFAKARGLMASLGHAPDLHAAFANAAFPLAGGYADMGMDILATGANTATCEAAIKSLNNAMYNHGYFVGQIVDDKNAIPPADAGRFNTNGMKIKRLEVDIREKCFMPSSSERVIKARNAPGSRRSRGAFDVEF